MPQAGRHPSLSSRDAHRADIPRTTLIDELSRGSCWDSDPGYGGISGKKEAAARAHDHRQERSRSQHRQRDGHVVPSSSTTFFIVNWVQISSTTKNCKDS